MITDSTNMSNANETNVPVSATRVVPVSVPVNHGEKLEKFNGLNFKRWQQKMLFYLTALNLARFLTEVNDSENDFQIIHVIDA